MIYLTLQQQQSTITSHHIENISTMASLTTENPHRYFCYLLIKHDIQQWMGFMFLLLGILLLAKSAHQFKKAKSIGIMNSTVRMIYITIWLWGIVFLLKYVISQIVYILQKQDEQSEDAYYKLSITSKYVFVVDITSVFLVQTSLICVCYNWVKDIVKQIKQLDDSFQIVNDRYLKSEVRLKKILKIYLILRFFFYLMVIPFIVVDQPLQQNTIVKIMLVLLLVEAFLVLLLLITGLLHVRKNKKLNELIQQTQLDTMVNRYAILILCAILRLGLDSIFVYMNFEHLSQNARCYINDLKPTEIARVCIDFFLGGLFTHCIPVYVILRIYNVIELEDLRLSESLLVTDNIKDGGVDEINKSR